MKSEPEIEINGTPASLATALASPCRVLGPILDEVAKEVGEKANIVKVNVDDNPELAQKYGIRGIPTMIF